MVDAAATPTEEAKAVARDTLNAEKERARSFLEDQKDALASQVSSLAAAMRSGSRSLAADGNGSTRLAQRTAEGMERLASSLHERDVRGLLEEAECFARRSPIVFLGGAATAGFLLARFLKSSRAEREGLQGRDGQPRVDSLRPDEGGETDRGGP